MKTKNSSPRYVRLWPRHVQKYTNNVKSVSVCCLRILKTQRQLSKERWVEKYCSCNEPCQILAFTEYILPEFMKRSVSLKLCLNKEKNINCVMLTNSFLIMIIQKVHFCYKVQVFLCYETYLRPKVLLCYKV